MEQNPLKKIVKEAFSFTTPTRAVSWETNMIRWPIGATTNSGASEDNFLNMAKMDEEAAKAPKIKPYPLDVVTDLIVTNYTNLTRLKKTLIEALKYPNLSNTDKIILKKEIKKLKKVIAFTKQMYYNIEKIVL